MGSRTSGAPSGDLVVVEGNVLGAVLTIPLSKGDNSAVSPGFMHQPRGCLGHWALPRLVLFKEPI